jgi:hypothetical protein
VIFWDDGSATAREKWQALFTPKKGPVKLPQAREVEDEIANEME